jgi:hypothetical protein
MARKSTKADMIVKMLKEGYTPKQIKKRLLVSDSYVHAMKNKLAQETFTLEEMGVSEETFVEVVAAASQGRRERNGEMERKVPRGPATVKRGPSTVKVEPKPEPEVSGVGKVLDARAEQYGSFMQSSDTVIRIKGIIHNAVARNEVHLYPDQLQALDMIATKISRIVHGNPNHLDSWIDIAGYATLVADRIQGKIR